MHAVLTACATLWWELPGPEPALRVRTMVSCAGGGRLRHLLAPVVLHSSMADFRERFGMSALEGSGAPVHGNNSRDTQPRTTPSACRTCLRRRGSIATPLEPLLNGFSLVCVPVGSDHRVCEPGVSGVVRHFRGARVHSASHHAPENSIKVRGHWKLSGGSSESEDAMLRASPRLPRAHGLLACDQPSDWFPALPAQLRNPPTRRATECSTRTALHMHCSCLHSMKHELF